MLNGVFGEKVKQIIPSQILMSAIISRWPKPAIQFEILFAAAVT